MPPSLDEKFIALLRLHTCLWDPTHKDYKTTIVRERTWKHLSDKMGMSILKCRSKYKELREKYRSRILRGAKSNADDDHHLIQQLHFLRSSFKNQSKVPNHVGQNFRRSSQLKFNSLSTQSNSSSLRATPTIHISDQSADPLFLDPDQLSNSSLKIEEFPNDLATLRIVEPTTNGSINNAPRTDNLEILSACSLQPSNSNNNHRRDKDVEEYIRLPQIPLTTHHQQPQQPQQPSGFVLALDEKLRLLPSRLRYRLEKDIFLMVSDEVCKMCE